MAVDVQTLPGPHFNGNGLNHMDGDAKEPKFAHGLILPPPEIKCEYHTTSASTKYNGLYML